MFPMRRKLSSKFSQRNWASHLREEGATQPPVQRPRRKWSRSLFDDEGRFQSHRAGDVVEVGRCCHHCLVNLGKLLLGAVASDAHPVAKTLITPRHGRVDAEKTAEIDFAFGFDHKAFERDPAYRTLRHIAYRR